MEIVTIGESENNDRCVGLFIDREEETGVRVAIAVHHRTAAPPRGAARRTTSYEETQKTMGVSGSRDNALIKCHESAPLYASAA